MIALRRLVAVALALVVLAIAGEEAAYGGGKVTIQLTQVLATDPGPGPKNFDPALNELRAQLEKYNYRTFKSAGSERRDCGDGEEAAFNLSAESGFSARVKPGGAGMIQLDILVKRDADSKEVLKTTIKVKDGGTTIVSKELENKQGTLFLVFTAKRG